MLSFFFFNDTATTEIYTLSLHDALPISARRGARAGQEPEGALGAPGGARHAAPAGLRPRARRGCAAHGAARDRADRKSTRLNSSHLVISYAVFCLKEKNDRPSLTSPVYT